MNLRRISRVQAGVCGVLALLLAVAAGCRRSEPAVSAGVTSAAAGDLASIAAEENAVLRIHRLSLWVGGLDAPALAKALKDAPPELQGDLFWLAGLRLAQLYPNESEEERGKRLSGATGENAEPAGRDKQPQTTEEKLLELARTDPEKALEQAMHSKLHPNDADNVKARILKQLGETDPERAMALMHARRDVDRSEVGGEIMESWGKRDPEAAFKWLAKQPATYATRQLTMSALEGWAATDVSAAMEKAATLPVGPDNEYTMRNIAEKWMREDPVLAAEWVKKQAHLDPVLAMAALRTFTSTNPALAAELLAAYVPPGRQQNEVDDVVRGWIAKDATACLAWLRTLPAGEARLRGLQEAGGALAKTNPAAAMALLKEWPADANPARLVKAIAGNLTDQQAAMTWLSTLPESQVKAEALGAVIGRMSDGNTEKLLSIAAGMPKGAVQTELFQRAASAKFDEDPAAAIAWVKTLTDPAAVTAVMEKIGFGWARTDPVNAAEFVKTMQPGKAYDSMVSGVVDRWTEKDPLAAANWAVTLPDTQTGRTAVGRTFAELAQYQPETAMRLMTAMPTGQFREYALSSAVSQLAKSRPSAGVELVTQLAPEKRQADFAERLSSGWSTHDLAGSMAWVSGLAAGEVRDGAIDGIAQNAAAANPAQALTLAASITKDSRRLSTIQEVLSAWYVQNPTSALAALSGLNLPEEKRAEIGKRLRGEK